MPMFTRTYVYIFYLSQQNQMSLLSTNMELVEICGRLGRAYLHQCAPARIVQRQSIFGRYRLRTRVIVIDYRCELSSVSATDKV